MPLNELARRSNTDPGYLSRVERGLRTPTDRWVRAVTTVLFAEMGSEDDVA